MQELNRHYRFHRLQLSIVLLIILMGITILFSLHSCNYSVCSSTSYTKDVAPLLFKHCVGCHRFNGPSHFSLETYEQAKENLKGLDFGQLKFIITCTGRVGSGAAQVMEDAGIRRVTPEEFLTTSFNEAIFTQLGSADMFVPKFKHIQFSREEFHDKPLNFKSNMEAYTQVADVLINAIYWDPKAPQLFTMKDMKKSSFKIKSIADITCDIAPESSIPSTIKATTIPQPVFGFLPLREKMVEPFTKSAIDVMSIPNLPSELPIDASKHFSENLCKIVIPEFFKEDSAMLRGARVTKNKQLTPEFLYLESYVYDDVYRASRIKS